MRECDLTVAAVRVCGWNQADSANALQLMKNFGRDRNSEGGKVRELQTLAESTAARAEGLYVMIGAVMGELAEVKKDGTSIRAMAVRGTSAIAWHTTIVPGCGRMAMHVCSRALALCPCPCGCRLASRVPSTT